MCFCVASNEKTDTFVERVEVRNQQIIQARDNMLERVCPPVAEKDGVIYSKTILTNLKTAQTLKK